MRQMKTRIKTELKACWFTVLSQLFGSKYYHLRSLSMKPERARAQVLRDQISPRLRWKILKRDNFTCTTCGRRSPNVGLEVDHIVSLAKGGTNSENNLTTLCF